ncbi:Copper homeostasis protein CutC [Vibrio stylophorae]|uniref:PF03932 family protein CutC n=1 Tax=Vibrio stylophorae TaxID=659351 RepID=A0ABN8DQQ2_9VIBR|nr:copper homeostasis protein CutC [Vibrio stylophorae]CAH0532838.1 Copper homeostasis protein CutC [Vibrio stylophorae]
MIKTLEVCTDSMESLPLAKAGGAQRIELCSALALGGLTPSYGLMQQAGRFDLPCYAMIRPRQGDFLFINADVEIMLADIHAAKQAGLAGVVIGALTAQGDIDMTICRDLMKAAQGMGVTFHRAIDHCRDWQGALEQVIELGCERILTSGQAANAALGINTLKAMVEQAKGRLDIMAGAGVNANNAKEIVTQTGVTELHLSGKTMRNSNMQFHQTQATMGQADCDDFAIPVTSSEAIQAVVSALR